jgi:hypothetical protein
MNIPGKDSMNQPSPNHMNISRKDSMDQPSPNHMNISRKDSMDQTSPNHMNISRKDSIDQPSPNHTNSINNSSTPINVISSSSNMDSIDPSGNEAIEGFDILGMENNLKRGKKSNSIPVSNQIRKSEIVNPYYHSAFGNSYTLY